MLLIIECRESTSGGPFIGLRCGTGQGWLRSRLAPGWPGTLESEGRRREGRGMGLWVRQGGLRDRERGGFRQFGLNQRFPEICRRKINRLAESRESRYLWTAFESTAPPAAFTESAFYLTFSCMIFSLSRPHTPHDREAAGACMSEVSSR